MSAVTHKAAAGVVRPCGSLRWGHACWRSTPSSDTAHAQHVDATPGSNNTAPCLSTRAPQRTRSETATHGMPTSVGVVPDMVLFDASAALELPRCHDPSPRCWLHHTCAVKLHSSVLVSFLGKLGPDRFPTVDLARLPETAVRCLIWPQDGKIRSNMEFLAVLVAGKRKHDRCRFRKGGFRTQYMDRTTVPIKHIAAQSDPVEPYL